MYASYLSPTTLAEALALKAEKGPRARIMAGGTDLLSEIERGLRRTPSGEPPDVIDLTRIAGLADIAEEDGYIHLGALVTHNRCVADPLIVEKAFALARACWEVGAPQIRNRGTLVGNVVTASPANDAIVPLLALDAVVTVQSAERGARIVQLAEFLRGVRSVDLADDEIVTRLSFPVPDPRQQGSFIKLGLRRAQAISVLSAAVLVTRDEGGIVQAAAVSLGAVAPTVIRAPAAEAYLLHKRLDDVVIERTAELAQAAARPIDDLRGGAEYRRAMVAVLVARLLRQMRDSRERAGWVDRPVLLWGQSDGRWPVGEIAGGEEAPAVVNGRTVHLTGGMTLLDSLRLAGFVGVKEGCAEGECGACTVFLDGMAVMACLVPAERAAGSEVVTVEGIGSGEHLHPVQAALVKSGGIQCGYCTPGFVMGAAKLLEERTRPTPSEVREALTGNLCRCTGYQKIVEAVVAAGAATT